MLTEDTLDGTLQHLIVKELVHPAEYKFFPTLRWEHPQKLLSVIQFEWKFMTVNSKLYEIEW